MRLVFRFLSFWQVGTGEGAMGTFDSRAARDPDGLPLIPGRQVKGLCRQAVYDAAAMGVPHVDRKAVVSLFGTRSLPGRPLHDETTAGLLRFSDARLPDNDRAALRGKADLIAGLFQSRRSTAMTDTGTARPHSLRYDEVVLPLVLVADVTPLPGVNVGNWRKSLTDALPLLNAVGSGRTRGLGRVIVTAEG
ncbi:MAG: RAMP superfamily CRISPR-associated protein [Gemmobacter sp.]